MKILYQLMRKLYLKVSCCFQCSGMQSCRVLLWELHLIYVHAVDKSLKPFMSFVIKVLQYFGNMRHKLALLDSFARFTFMAWSTASQSTVLGLSHLV